MKIPVYNQAGEQVQEEELDLERLGPVRMKLLKQVVLAYEANRRVGTASTKRRGEIAGSGRKMYRQKGTGFARMGGRRSPVRVGGSVAHGPRPRDYRQAIQLSQKWITASPPRRQERQGIYGLALASCPLDSFTRSFPAWGATFCRPGGAIG